MSSIMYGVELQFVGFPVAMEFVNSLKNCPPFEYACFDDGSCIITMTAANVMKLPTHDSNCMPYIQWTEPVFFEMMSERYIQEQRSRTSSISASGVGGDRS